MRYLADFDEIHRMASMMLNEYNEEEIIESILNILRLAYIRGTKKVCEELDWEWEDYLLFGDWEEEVILKKKKKKNVIDRIKEYIETNNNIAKYIDEKSIIRVKKTWCTQLDEKVRDTHDYLEGISVYMDEKFFTYDGDEARFPGDFGLAENNVNCRCYLKYTR